MRPHTTVEEFPVSLGVARRENPSRAVQYIGNDS